MLKRDNSDDEVYESGSPGLLPGLEMLNNLPNMQGLVQGLVPLPGMGPPMGAHVGLQMQTHHRTTVDSINQLPMSGGMVGVAHGGLPAGAALLPHATTPAGAVLTLNLTPAANDEQPKMKKIKPNDAQPMVPRQKRGRKKKEEPQEETVTLAAGVSSRGRERKPRSFAYEEEQAQFAYSLNASNSQRYQRRIKGESYDDGEVIYFKSEEEAAAAAAAAAVGSVGGEGSEGRTENGPSVDGSIGTGTRDGGGGEAATNGPSGPAPYSSGGVGVLAAAGAGAVGGAGVDYRSAGRGQTRSFGDEEDDDDDDEDDEEDS